MSNSSKKKTKQTFFFHPIFILRGHNYCATVDRERNAVQIWNLGLLLRPRSGFLVRILGFSGVKLSDVTPKQERGWSSPPTPPLPPYPVTALSHVKQGKSGNFSCATSVRRIFSESCLIFYLLERWTSLLVCFICMKRWKLSKREKCAYKLMFIFSLSCVVF